MSQAKQTQHFTQTARRGWLVRASRLARNAAFSLLGSKRASHAGKSLGCSNRISHSLTNQGEKKQKFKVYQIKTCSAVFFIEKVHKQKRFKNYFGSPRPQIKHSENVYFPLKHIIPFNYKNSRLSCAGWELYQYRRPAIYFYIVCLGPSSR